MEPQLSWYLALSAVLFTIGAAGVIMKRNVIAMFMCIELMLNAVNLTFIAFSSFFQDVTGQLFVFIVMTVAAAEAAVGRAHADARMMGDLVHGDVEATGTEQVGFTLILTEGFGSIPMAGKTFALLSAHAGQPASISGATQIRAGVIRPEIIIPKGTAHGGTLVTSGPVKALAIKIPPQARDDVTFVN